ncbi:PcfJ domain-containing protein [Enterococcus casseliflavus]|uniref:PcfJ domain-containing protein n=1 Tax=Enterococcus casseliflavus TaxID=37734 RepID=UPI0022E6881D|nr:PcfJ domain-containing protein [Enterococcus casseliflavus]MEB6088200.1 PcfJ domain-containing protein [Enterococcus casseliflavus]
MRKMKTPNDYAKNCLKPPKAFFEWCYYNMPTYKWANKQQTIIASERKHYFTEEKRLTKNSRLTFFDRRDHFQIILSTSKRIEIQTYEVRSLLEKGKQHFRVKLVNLEHFSNNTHIKVGAVSDTTYDFRLVQLGNMLSMYAQHPTLYPNDWNDRLFNVSELRYLTIDSIYGDEIAFIYKYRQRIEYAQRINAPALAKQILERKLDMRSITMNWLKRNKVFFRNSQRTYQAYQVKQALESLGTKYISGVEAFMGVDDISKIPEGVKPITFQNYLMKQKRTIGFYQDYLNMLNELGLPITPMTRLPKDLKMAHDKAVATLNAMKREIVRKEFEKRAIEEDFLEMTIKDVQFILPKEANDLIEEGKSLKHCVGGRSYINQHAEGETTIVFARKTTEPDKPYYTIEYCDSRLVQVHGFKNKRPDEQLREIVNQWLHIVNKRYKTEEKKHVA